MMKKRRLISAFALLFVCAVLGAQSVSLNLGRVTVKDAMTQLKKQTSYSFVFATEDVDVRKEVNVSASSLEQAVTQIIAGQNLNYEIDGKNIVLTVARASQPQQTASRALRQISGTVFDEQTSPVMGAYVVEKGNDRNGVITDIDGNFSISVPTGAKLSVSYIGYATQELTVAGKNSFVINLEPDMEALKEVVVVGYGAVKKSDLTYSVAKMTGDQVKNRPITVGSDVLQGMVAGVRTQAQDGLPGEEMTVRIRGTNTINGDSSPLYVIDGVPYDSMGDIAPADIESIQILKDAAATSIYGARGGNGVVLVETKQGTTAKPQINFSAYYGFQQRESKIDMMSGPEWVAYYGFRKNVAHVRAGGSMSDPMSSRSVTHQIPDYWLTKENFTDWQDEVFRLAPIQEYNVSASSKYSVGSTYFSAGYMRQDGVLLNSYYDRLNARLNQVVRLSKRLAAGLNFNFTNSSQEGAGASQKEAALHHALQVTPLMDIDQGTVEWGFPENIGMTYPNPKVRLESTKSFTKNLSMGASIYLDFRIAKYLSFKTQASYNYAGKTYEFFVPGNVAYNNGYTSTGSSYTSTQNKWTWQNTLTFNYNFKGDNKLNVVIGHSMDRLNSFRQDSAATGWPYESLYTLNLATTPTLASTSRYVRSSISFFGRANYSYKDRYLFTVSARYDGSSRFGYNTKWGFFPSASAGWKISSEPFLAGARWLDLLKIRASWGQAGNDRIGDYTYASMLTSADTSWGNTIIPGLAPANISNPELQWERTTSIDLGFDFSAWRNRVQLNFDYYFNRTDNLLFNVTVPFTTGFDKFTDNVGAISNRGWEIDLTTHNISRPKFSWSTSLNLSGNTNKVLDMGDVSEIIVQAYDAFFITRVGGPISQFYCLSTDGLLGPDDFDSYGNPLVPIMTGQRIGNVKYVDANFDESITEADYVAQGSNLPDLIYGMTNRFHWGCFDLSILLQGQLGGKLLFLGQRQYDNGGSLTSMTNQLRHWLHGYKEDYEAIYGEDPVLHDYCEAHGIDMSWDGVSPNVITGKNDNNDMRRIYDSSYLRIKNVNFSFTFPTKWFSHKIVKAASLYVSIDNVYTFTKYPGFNVETNTFGNNTTMQGVDYSSYPLSRKYIFGANITF